MLDKLRLKLDNMLGRRDQVLEDIKASTKAMTQLKQDVEEFEQVQAMIQLAAKRTQDQLKFVIEPPVNEGIASVFDHPYTFELRFEEKDGGRVWARQIFKRDGHEYRNLMFSGGGGAVDVAAFALQVAGLCLTTNRKLLFLDEPLKHLKSKDKSLEERGSLMIQEISHKLGIQVIMISHIPEQQAGADKIYSLSIENGVTQGGE